MNPFEKIVQDLKAKKAPTVHVDPAGPHADFTAVQERIFVALNDTERTASFRAIVVKEGRRFYRGIPMLTPFEVKGYLAKGKGNG